MPSQRELSRPPCTRPKSIRSLPRSIRWVAWEKYRKSWMQYCISTRRVSSLEKFFTSMEDRRPVTTRSESLRRVIMTTIIECRPPVAEKSAEGHQEQAKTRQPDIKVITEQAMWNTAITRTYGVDYPFIAAGMAM